MDRLAQGRLAERQPVAVIDIGSNSIRLVVYEGLARSPTPLFQEKVMCGLGRSLSLTNRLHEPAVSRAIAALRRFRLLISQCGARACYAFATAAVRWAEDGEAFIAEAEKACGFPIRIVSGTDEADLARMGILAGFPNPDGIVGDLGGGSLDLADVQANHRGRQASLPLGGLALIDASRGDRVKAAAIIENSLAGVDWLSEGRGRTFYAVGGTWRALAKLHMARTDYPLSAIHGFTLSRDKAMHTSARFANMSPRALRKMSGMSSGREETLPYGALLLNRIIQRLQPDSVTFSAFGVREGLLFSLMSAEEQAADPLITACEEVARLRSRSPEHANELIAWTEALFNTPELAETREEARLRRAACLLADIAWRAHPDYRGEQSVGLIAQSALVGLDHPGRAFLALAVYHRYGRSISGELLEKLAGMLRPRAQTRALIIGTAVRLANNLSAGMPGVLPHTPLVHDGGSLALTLPARYAALDGESVHRRLRILAGIMGKAPELRIATKSGSSVTAFLRTLIGKESEDIS